MNFWLALVAWVFGVMCGRTAWFMKRMQSLSVAQAHAHAQADSRSAAVGVVVVGDAAGTLGPGSVADLSDHLGSARSGGALVSGREVIEVEDIWAEEVVTP